MTMQKPMHPLVVKDHKAFGHKHLNPHGFDNPDEYVHEEDDAFFLFGGRATTGGGRDLGIWTMTVRRRR